MKGLVQILNEIYVKVMPASFQMSLPFLSSQSSSRSTILQIFEYALILQEMVFTLLSKERGTLILFENAKVLQYYFVPFLFSEVNKSKIQYTTHWGIACENMH